MELIHAHREAASRPRRETEAASPSHKKRWISLGAAAAGLAVVVGIGLGLNNSGHDSNAAAPGQQPTVTAPAVPGTITEQQGAPITAPDAKPYANLTIDNFPFKGPDGKIYEGLDTFQRAHELRVEDYMGGNFHNLLPAVVSQMTEWGCAGADRQTADAYQNYTSADGSSTGAKAIANDFYNKAFSRSLSTNSSFTSKMENSNSTCLTMFNQTKNSPINYKAEYQATLVSYTNAGTGVQYDVLMNYSDNLPDAATHPADITPVRMALVQRPGADGRPVWKVYSYGDSPS
jgi:hypothetical protein